MTAPLPDAVGVVVGKLMRTFAKFEHDNHGGYGECTGSGQVWVDDGAASNYYRGGTCKRCADNTPATVNPDGPEAATLIQSQAARIAELEKGLKPFVRAAEVEYDLFGRKRGCDPMDGWKYGPAAVLDAAGKRLIWSDYIKARSLLSEGNGA